MEQQKKDVEKYGRMKAQQSLMREINIGRKSGEKEGWISAKDVRDHYATIRESFSVRVWRSTSY